MSSSRRLGVLFHQGIFTLLHRGSFWLRQLFGNGRCIRAPEELLRIDFEFITTTNATEMVSRACVFTRSSAVGRINLYTAHRIFRRPSAAGSWPLVPFVLMAMNLRALPPTTLR